VVECFGVTPDEWQKKVMDAYSAGKRRISIRSGHGVGKTTVLAWIIIHHILTKFPQKTVCTAASEDQLYEALAAECKAWILKLAPELQALLEVRSESIDLKASPNESFVSFRVSRADKPEAMAGVHSDNVLLVGDEASGIPDPIFESGAGSMSGHNATTILAGNPVRSSGLFFDTHDVLKDIWETFHVSCLDCSRVSPDFVEDMRRRYGERSNAFRVRVLGEFPMADDDTIIPAELAAAALDRDVRPLLVREIWGVDVGRFGDDPSALYKRKGNVRMDGRIWHGKDTMGSVAEVKAEWDACQVHDRPEEILVDSIGVGAGVCDRLRELGLPARGINVSESPAMRDRYINLRAELWFKGREWLARRDCSLGGDKELIRELTAVKYKYQPNGKIKAESKDDMKKRGEKSPNRADAFLLTFASEAVSAAGSSTQKSWSQPLKRAIKSIV
jgi:phage terminase large subunit